jgi:hypothetical protein
MMGELRRGLWMGGGCWRRRGVYGGLVLMAGCIHTVYCMYTATPKWKTSSEMKQKERKEMFAGFTKTSLTETNPISFLFTSVKCFSKDGPPYLLSNPCFLQLWLGKEVKETPLKGWVSGLKLNSPSPQTLNSKPRIQAQCSEIRTFVLKRNS